MCQQTVRVIQCAGTPRASCSCNIHGYKGASGCATYSAFGKNQVLSDVMKARCKGEWEGTVRYVHGTYADTRCQFCTAVVNLLGIYTNAARTLSSVDFYTKYRVRKPRGSISEPDGRDAVREIVLHSPDYNRAVEAVDLVQHPRAWRSGTNVRESYAEEVSLGRIRSYQATL